MTPSTWRGRIGIACLASGLTAAAGYAFAAQRTAIPPNATALEGHPTVRVEATKEHVARHELVPAEITQNALRIRIADGQYFWASRGDLPLAIRSTGDFTYLSSAEPGKYIRITRLNDRLSYVEHIEMPLGSVTYWGELRVVLGR